MASFYAELQVAGQHYPVRECSYEFMQATGERGRVSAKVRHGLVHLTLDVPPDDVLVAWACKPHYPLTGQVVFADAKGGATLETLAWEGGQCVGYREEFASGDASAGAYVCHLTIAAPQLRLQPGGPAAYVPPAAREHGSPQQALINNPFTITSPLRQPVTTPVSPPVELPLTPPPTPPLSPLLARLWAGVLRVLTSAPAMTAALLLTPTNSPDDDGYKSEKDLGKLMQTPTDKDRARLDYLEAERERRALSEDEEDELASLLAIVRKVFVGGRAGLPGYYVQQAEAAHLRQIVPDFEGVHLAGHRGEAAGEFDGINMAGKIFIEDKSAQGLDRVNPKTGLKHQTPATWAHKQIFNKTVNRIEALHNAPYTYSTPNGPPHIPNIEQIRNFERLHFRVDADTPEVRKAVEEEIQNLKTRYPNWHFTAQYGN
jgi:hypothetical protein